MATTTGSGTLGVPAEKIHVPDNVRAIDERHVDALAGSIALQGLLTPVVLAPVVGEPPEQAYEFQLVAGFHRYAAVCKLGHTAIDAVIHTATEVAEQGSALAGARASENIVRKQLNPYEEAVAVRAMLDRGFTDDGAAQALGWPKARVTARVKLLELPELAQQMVGDGRLPLAAVDQLRQIGTVSPDLLDAVVEYLADGNEWMAERIAREPGWVLDSAIRTSGVKVFASHLSSTDTRELAELKLGKKIETLIVEATEIHKKLDRYAYGSPEFRFTDEDVDQARAAGVLIEFENSRPIIVDRPTYRELCKQAVKRTVEQLRAKQAALVEERKQAKAAGRSGVLCDPAAEAKREHGREMRQLAEQAHGVNTDLGWALRNGLANVDPADPTVAKFFVYALLGSDHDGSPYTQSGALVAELAVRGIGLVVDEFRTDVTKTRKDGSRGALRVDYGDPRKPEEAVAWLWKFIDGGAKTAGDLYGRALVVIAAEQYALRLVVPSSQQHPAKRWSSHEDHAAKALAKLAGPHLPASLKQLEKAIAKAKADHDKRQTAARDVARQAASAARQTAPDELDENLADDLEVDDPDRYEYDDGELDDYAGTLGPDGTVYSDVDAGL
jgi:ParB/RepB/Spo0J family partition protein